MENKNKIFIAILVATSVISINISWVDAMNGQWLQKGKMQQENNISTQDSTHNPSDMLSDIPMSELDETEKNNLLYSYAEETLAHDMYSYFYEIYWLQTFANIANSEAEHQLAVKSLLDRYSIDIPTDYGELNDEFLELKAKWELSLKDAIEVWINIEILDIEDIAQTIINTDNDDIKAVYVNIGWASYNHLRGFVSALNNNGFETELDYNKYLTLEEINDKSIVVKHKMAEKVISEWVVLPEWFNPEDIKSKCQKEGQNSENSNSKANKKWQLQWNGKWNNNYNKSNNWYVNANSNKYINENVIATKNKYKNTIEKKYSPVIKQLSDEKITELISKIDKSIEDINNSEMDQNTKENYTAIFMALKEVTMLNLKH